MHGRVLIIAGSDSGGGAGIQADIKTVTALGGFAMTAITALTAQNTLGVHGIFEVPPEFVAEQIRVVMEDIGADCIKTGMLHRADVIDAVAEALDRYAPDVPLIVDPVMIAKGGASLLEDSAILSVRQKIIPRATLITPNAPEAGVLAGMAVKTQDDAMTAARSLATLGPKSILITGGHLDGEAGRVTDVFLHGEGTMDVFESERIETKHTHGTGCTLASAIAAGVAAGMEMRDAIVRARQYVHEAIRTAPGYGHGHGPLNHAHTVSAIPNATNQS